MDANFSLEDYECGLEGATKMLRALLARYFERMKEVIERQMREEQIRELNQQLERRSAELEASNKELEAFAYSISHDLRAPLRHMVGFSELLQQHAVTALDEKSRWYTTTILDAAKRMGALIDDLEASLARADLDIAAAYEELAPAALGRFGGLLREEFGRVRAQVLAIKQIDALMDRDPTLQRSIELRNPYVDPVNLLQVDLLRRWRESGRQDRDLFEGLLACTAGIAEGLQSTG